MPSKVPGPFPSGKIEPVHLSGDMDLITELIGLPATRLFRIINLTPVRTLDELLATYGDSMPQFLRRIILERDKPYLRVKS
jgi:hypothetical protein